MGISASGYLGVDVFFVINGFLIIPKVVRGVESDNFNFWSFLEKRVVRLLPLILLVSAFSLIVGYYGMLPDDYENLSESVIATNLFSNNILFAITARDYWNVLNDYKALMHTWYIGILFEFYLLFPLFVMLIKWLSKRFRFSFEKYVVITILSLSIISVLLYLDPSVSTGDRFYFIQYRFFEIAFGGLAGIWIFNHRQGLLYRNGTISGIGFVILLFVLFVGVFYVKQRIQDINLVSGTVDVGGSYIPQNILLLLTVVLTIFYVVSDNLRSRLISRLVRAKFFCLLGMMSYSIYIWHQPILAFYRYYVSKSISLSFILSFLLFVLLLSYVTYRLVEQKVTAGFRTRIAILISFLFINGFALDIYMHAGVVRDVPELDISLDNVHRNMHKDYTDRIKPYTNDFPPDNGKINVLVIGNSFARDWGNILLESRMADKINLSYVNNLKAKHIDRIKRADYVFYFGWKHNVPYYVWENLSPKAQVWGIGTKNFGESNGIIYQNRHRADYYMQTININPNYFVANKQLKAEWKDKYIDLLKLVETGNGKVMVFTPNHKYISFDTHHLTQGGVEYYAKEINFDKIFMQL